MSFMLIILAEPSISLSIEKPKYGGPVFNEMADIVIEESSYRKIPSKRIDIKPSQSPNNLPKGWVRNP